MERYMYICLIAPIVLTCLQSVLLTHASQSQGAVDDLKLPLSEADSGIRMNVYKALQGVSSTRVGVNALVNAGYITIFVNKIEVEDALVQEIILATLHACVNDMKGVQIALANRAVELCIRLLHSENPAVR